MKRPGTPKATLGLYLSKSQGVSDMERSEPTLIEK